MNPSTITLANVYVERQGGTGNWNDPDQPEQLSGGHDRLQPTHQHGHPRLHALCPRPPCRPTITRLSSRAARPVSPTWSATSSTANSAGPSPQAMAPPGTDFFEDLGLQVLQAPVITTFQMTAATDTGIPGDQNTNRSQPQFIGQVYNSFPGTVANLQVYVEFNGLHPALNGGFDLAVGGAAGPRPRGQLTTFDDDELRRARSRLLRPRCRKASSAPRSWWSARPTSPLCRGCPPRSNTPSGSTRPRRWSPESARSTARLPRSPANLSSLQSLTLDVQDPVNQAYSYLATPSQVLFPAIDPSTAANISNYSLILSMPTAQQVGRVAVHHHGDLYCHRANAGLAKTSPTTTV